VPVALGVVADSASAAAAYAVVVVAIAPVMLLLTRNVRRSVLVSQS
jgi:hypothetical protein